MPYSRQGDILMFQNKKLHLDLHVQTVAFKFYVNTLQKYFESADYEQLGAGQENMAQN